MPHPSSALWRLVFPARRAERSGVEAWAEQGGVEACFAAWRRRVMKPALLVFLARSAELSGVEA